MSDLDIADKVKSKVSGKKKEISKEVMSNVGKRTGYGLLSWLTLLFIVLQTLAILVILYVVTKHWLSVGKSGGKRFRNPRDISPKLLPSYDEEMNRYDSDFFNQDVPMINDKDVELSKFCYIDACKDFNHIIHQHCNDQLPGMKNCEKASWEKIENHIKKWKSTPIENKKCKNKLKSSFHQWKDECQKV
ncbi:hypothetical protein SNEBB_005501 [Seison nebaliae]|nr:hypothetical protein SNEBB_005501 [Seison nebaliae]